MADLCFSISSLSQFYSLICSYFVMFSYLINISLLLLPLIYHNFAPRSSQPGSTCFLLALIYDIFSPRSSEHGSGFVVSREFTEEFEVLEKVFLLEETSSFDVAECPKVEEYDEIIHNYSKDVFRIESKLRSREDGRNIDDRVTLCVKSHDDFVECGSNIGCTGQEEEWKSTLAWKLFEERQYNVVEGDEGMDSLWEAFEADSIKCRQRIDVVVKKKDMKQKSGELSKNNINEDDEEDQVEMTSGCLQGFKCCSTGTGGKMNMTRGRSSIVQISKPLKLINWWRHLKRHAKTNIFFYF
ncbi:hypothetical protein POM88_053957 [Heracleum sosnowskyi]|uniref:Uncharacterized protein n=1 Tax=Heracleum sosnowskyi TaxID=360622 RepID=A0AAD8GNL2_9APIA|nr:hypothetical protein POM88_053957 [Heracleum sosnowskyi]